MYIIIKLPRFSTDLKTQLNIHKILDLIMGNERLKVTETANTEAIWSKRIYTTLYQHWNVKKLPTRCL